MSYKLKLEKRVIQAAEELLHEKEYVSPLDMLLKIGYLHLTHVQDWRKGRIRCLEEVMNANLKKISFAMSVLRKWAFLKQLIPSRTEYLRRTSGPRTDLRFCISGNPNIEAEYRKHYISPLLSEKKRQKLKEKMDKPPELVAFMTVGRDSACSRCQTAIHQNGCLFKEAEEALCMKCANLHEHVFLPSGDAKLTRKAKGYSTKPVVVVRFSRTRKRYERQGILIEPHALEKAEAELMDS